MPNCKRKWDERLGEINWGAVGARYKMGLVTPADYGTHFKCIGHRYFKLRRGEQGAAQMGTMIGCSSQGCPAVSREDDLRRWSYRGGG